MTIAQAFNEITTAQGGTPNAGGTIAGAIDALNDTLAGSDQKPAQTIEGAIRLLGAHIGGGVAPSGTIEITENGEGIDVAQYAYADVNVSGGGGGTTTYKMCVFDGNNPQTALTFNVYDEDNNNIDTTVEVLEMQGEGGTMTMSVRAFVATAGARYEMYSPAWTVSQCLISRIERTGAQRSAESIENGHIFFVAPNFEALIVVVS